MVQEGLLFYCWGLAEGKPEAAGGSSSSSHSLLENNMGERERGGEREGERGRGGGREEGKGSEREREILQHFYLMWVSSHPGSRMHNPGLPVWVT